MVEIPLNCADMVGGKMYGAHLHGHIISQLIGLAEGKLSPLETTSQRVRSKPAALVIDGAWIGLWTLLGGLVVLILPSPSRLMTGTVSGLLILVGVTFSLFTSAG